MNSSADNEGVRGLLANLLALPANLRDAVIRHGPPTTGRARSQSVFGNVFLHLHAVRTHRWSLKPTFTFGLGIASLAAFVILTVTGLVLMVYFKPTAAAAYSSVKDINFAVPGGQFIRNVHRWSGHLMVVLVLLHLVRVALTGSYRRPREFNWLVGIGLLILTFALAFTGYCLPWDQLGYWAIMIGSNIAASPSEVLQALHLTNVPDVGAMTRLVLLGARSVGDDALLRFYVLHCVILPMGLVGLLAVHFWRIRKDGGMSRPDDIRPEELSMTPVDDDAEQAFAPEKTYGLMALVKGTSPGVGRSPEQTVSSWPHLLLAELAVVALVLALVLVLGLLVDAPLSELANPAVPENPAKAPWYFLGLQECVSYSAFSGGILIPNIILVVLAMFPFIDRGTSAGRVLGGKGEPKVFSLSLAVAAAAVVSMLVFSVRYGWMRNWWPEVNQCWIILVNPGTVLVALAFVYAAVVLVATNSLRKMVVALLACFLAGFVILSYFALIHRGPNWEFFWWPSMWPGH